MRLRDDRQTDRQKDRWAEGRRWSSVKVSLFFERTRIVEVTELFFKVQKEKTIPLLLLFCSEQNNHKSDIVRDVVKCYIEN